MILCFSFLLLSMDKQTLFFISFFSSFLCAISAMATTTTLSNNSTDKATLLSFKLCITNEPSEALSSWNDTTHFCNWEGIFCSKRNKGRVVYINLSSQGLNGYITSSIANLTFLHHLDLNQNQLSGIIPISLFMLPRIHFLNLSLNSLYGEIPFNLSSSLITIDLRRNYITGNIPSSLGHLSMLKYVSLSRNNLTGKIPPSLGNLSLLQHIDLFNNELEGSLPKGIGNHPNLQFLQVSSNKLSGELPASIFNLSSAYAFSISLNDFEGKFPSSFGNNLPNLQKLLMSLNQFTGPIPASLFNASKLYFIDMSNNNFIGMIPSKFGRLEGLERLCLEFNQLEASDHSSWKFMDDLTNCSKLVTLRLNDNKLSGILPTSIANLSKGIQRLFISSNHISGSIPSGIGNLKNLIVLYLEPNDLIGTVPESICKLAKLEKLDMYGGMLTGNLPYCLGNLTQMMYLHLQNNYFNGSIPVSIGNLKSLLELNIDKNNLNGNIPKEIFTFPSIYFFSLAFNSLTGHIASEIGDLEHVVELYLQENKLSGEIPSSIDGCMSLEVLKLSSNMLQGTIPPSMGDIKGLLKLDLSSNNLTGRIPKALGILKGLEYLNLSFNHLVSEVPSEGIFLNTTATSIQGNYGLCGGISNFYLPACPHISSSRKRKLPHLSLLAILLPCMATFSLILFSILCFNCRRRNLLKNSLNPNIMENAYPKVSYLDLVRATNQFSPSNILGIGQYGLVYKGSLDNYGFANVAIKVFNLHREGGSKAFLVECEALKRIKHRNIVKIITCCVSIDSEGNDFMAIVFELMTNGNLDTMLHTEDIEHLDLNKRLDIAINITNALCYLHHECEKTIIHCDLKPSNVLLDGDMVAQVADFGLATSLHGSLSNRPRDSNNSTPMLRGTIGYTAPEYGLGSQVSTMGDVYSYGILLLELFTSRRPIDKIFKDGLNIQKFVEMAIPDRVMDIIDPKLHLKFQNEGGIQSRKAAYECLTSILRLSLLCSKESARDRISILDVAVELNSIRDVYFKACL